MTDPQITAAAHAVATARSQFEKAAQPLQAAESQRDLIDSRQMALEDRRREITTRRASGDYHPDDGPTLALIVADLEGLTPIRADAEAAIAAIAGPVAAARQAVQVAEQGLLAAEDAEAERALISHATNLDGLLLQTVGHLAAVRQRLGAGRPRWCPSQTLILELRKLQAALGQL